MSLLVYQTWYRLDAASKIEPFFVLSRLINLNWVWCSDRRVCVGLNNLIWVWCGEGGGNVCVFSFRVKHLFWLDVVKGCRDLCCSLLVHKTWYGLDVVKGGCYVPCWIITPGICWGRNNYWYSENLAPFRHRIYWLITRLIIKSMWNIQWKEDEEKACSLSGP